MGLLRDAIDLWRRTRAGSEQLDEDQRLAEKSLAKVRRREVELELAVRQLRADVQRRDDWMDALAERWADRIHDADRRR